MRSTDVPELTEALPQDAPNRHARHKAGLLGISLKEARPNMIDPPAYSVEEFCKAHRFGKTTFYYLKKIGRAPDEMRIGGRSIIPGEAAARFRQRMIDEPIEGGLRPAAEKAKAAA
jgi:hypothetical protein